MKNRLLLKRSLQKAAIWLLLFGLLLPKPCSAGGPPPVITVQPLSQTVLFKDSVTFLVVVSSGTTVSYQWLKNGANISGAILSTYTIADAKTTDQGTYSVKVTNAGGSVTSSGAVLTVLVRPGITTQPQDQTVALGQNPSFSVAATGTTPLSYQWYFNGTAVSGLTGSTCTISNAQLANAGTYTVGISNAVGTVISSNAVLTVVNPVISVDNTSSASTNATTLSWSHTVGSGNSRILIVGVAIHNSDRTVTSATYGSQNLTLIGQSVDASGKVEVNLYQLVAPPVGSANVTIVINGKDTMSGGAVSFTGVSQRSPVGPFASAGGSGLSGSVSLSSATNEVVVDIMGATGDAKTLAAVGYQMPRWTNLSGTGPGDAIGASSTVIGSPTTMMSWSLGASKSWALGAVALKPVPALALQADVCTTQTSPTNVIAGANYTCTIAVTNAGPATATNLMLAEALPAGVDFFSASGGGTSNNGVAIWPPFNLISGSTTNFTLTLTTPAVGKLTNTVSSTADTYDPDTSNNDGSAAGANVVTIVSPQGSPSFVSGANATATNVSTMFWSHTVPSGANRLLLAGFSFGDNSKTVLSVTCGGTNLSFVGRSAVYRGVELWSLVNPPVGTANIVATWSGKADTVLWSASFTNVDQTSPLGSFQSASAQSTTPSLTVGSATGNLVVDILAATGDAGTLTADANQTTIAADNTGTAGGNARGGGSYKTGASSVTMSWTLEASKSWDLGAVTLNAARPVQADVVATESGPTSVCATSNLTYTITIANAGPASATNLVVRAPLPTGSAFVSASGGGTNASGMVNWGIASLAYAETTNFTVTVTAPTSGTLTNTVSSTAATSDPYASNNDGTSAAATVVTLVYTPPTITAQPQPQSLTVTQGQTASFTVVASGTAPLSYQWSLNGTPLTGATSSALTLNNGPSSSTLTLNNVQTTDAGTYTVEVANVAGSITSAGATLTVLVPPTILTQPQSQVVTAGQNATLSVTATGTDPLSYQWSLNGAALSGATNSTLTLNSVQTTDAGSYTVMVANPAGSVPSAVAMLAVTNPPPSAPPSLVAAGMTTNGFKFQLSAPAGQTYIISVTTNLRDWTPVYTNVALSDTVDLIDPGATNYSKRFYRAMVQ
jgi:uncharacterized repeat protein (TIGR01451 family)